MGADNTSDSLRRAGSQFSVNAALQNSFSPLSSPERFERVELLNYTNASGKELVGLVVELAEDPNGGVQVRVLRDSDVVSCVSVVDLKECVVDESQRCDCCE